LHFLLSYERFIKWLTIQFSEKLCKNTTSFPKNEILCPIFFHALRFFYYFCTLEKI